MQRDLKTLSGDFLVMASGYFGIYERAYGMVSIPEMLAGMAGAPAMIEGLLEKITEYKVEVAKRVVQLEHLKACQERVTAHILMLADQEVGTDI